MKNSTDKPASRKRAAATKTKERAWYPLSGIPEGFFRPVRRPGSLACPDEALSLPPFYAALRYYQTTVSNLPFLVYQKTDQGRERYKTHPAYKLLADRPNPAQSRAKFLEYVIEQYFMHGNAYVQVQWLGNGKPGALRPIPAESVLKIEYDRNWRKTYTIAGLDSPLQDDEVIHVYNFSRDGFMGISFLDYAAESLGVHRQILESANAYYSNAARPSGYISYPGKLDKQAIDNLKAGFKDEYGGTTNTGKVPVLEQSGKFEPLPNTSAQDSQMVEALRMVTLTCAQWFGLSPLLLGDLERGTYSNSLADNMAFYRKNLAPLLNVIEQEVNYKLFGSADDVYAEFLVENLLRGDPREQAEIYKIATGGKAWLKPSEVREFLNLPAAPELDQEPAQEQPDAAQVVNQNPGGEQDDPDQNQ